MTGWQYVPLKLLCQPATLRGVKALKAYRLIFTVGSTEEAQTL